MTTDTTPPGDILDDFLTIADAARLLHVSTRTVWPWVPARLAEALPRVHPPQHPAAPRGRVGAVRARRGARASLTAGAAWTRATCVSALAAMLERCGKAGSSRCRVAP